TLGPLPGELSRLAPSLRSRLPDLPPPLTAEPETERYRLFEAVAGWLTDAGSASPVLLVLEDIHWLPKPALLLLRHVLRSAVAMRLLVVGTYRDTELGRDHPLHELLGDIHRLPGVTRLTLSGLGQEEVARLVGAPELAASVHTRTEGNPFFVGELLHELEEGHGGDRRSVGSTTPSVPDSVRDVIRWRIARLPAIVEQVLSVAAVLGREFDVAVLVGVHDADEEDVLDALEQAQQAGIVAEVPGPRDTYRFVHTLIRSALYDAIPAPRRMRLHLRVARALEARPDAEARVPELAHHFSEAVGLGEVQPAVRYHRLAGDRARNDLAFEVAASHYEHALVTLDAALAPDRRIRCDLLVDLGDVLHRAGDPRHRGVLLEAAAEARALHDPARLGQAGLTLNKTGVASRGEGVDEELVGILEEAAVGLEPSPGPLRAQLLAVLAVELLWTPDVDRRVALGDEAVAMARAAGDPTALAKVLVARHIACCGPDNLGERLAEAADLIALGEELGDLEVGCRGHLFSFDALMEKGEVHAADPHLTAASDAADELQQFFVWDVATRRAGRALLSGRLDAAEPLIDEAYRVGGERGVDPSSTLAVYGAQLVMLRSEQGRLDELVDVVAVFSASRMADPVQRVVLAFAYAETGRLDEARAEFDALAADAFRSLPRDIPWLACVTMLCRVCATLGDADRALVLHGLLEPFAGRLTWPVTLTVGPTDFGLGLLASTRADLPGAIRSFDAASLLCQRNDAPGWLARTELAWAEALCRLGGGDDLPRARTLAGHALLLAENLGLQQVVERAASLV
ncbi:MAG: hypothetical protein M3133_07330, partial [Actinomycetota bacterium]|nr:hypothetical protein [Actinomycetota bacterium]